MIDLPDDPAIRNAELYGAPGYAPDIKYRCPCCGADEPESFVIDMYETIVGCSECTKTRDAYEWASEHAEEPFEE